MPTTTNYRAAKNGVPRSIRLDDIANVRLAYCERVANEVLSTKSSASTIIRRALVLYQAHCEGLVEGSIGQPEDAQIYRNFEATQLRYVNAGFHSSKVTVKDVTEAVHLKTIGELEREKPPKHKRLIDELKAALP